MRFDCKFDVCLTEVLKHRCNYFLSTQSSGALVANVILHHVYVMDAISRRLDVSCKGNQNWRHLAILNDVSTDLQLKWQSGERHCRSEKMFEVVFTIDPDLLIGTLQQHLRDLKINNVEHYLGSLHLEGKCCISLKTIHIV